MSRVHQRLADSHADHRRAIETARELRSCLRALVAGELSDLAVVDYLVDATSWITDPKLTEIPESAADQRARADTNVPVGVAR